MSKPAGTPGAVGLIHMPMHLLKPPAYPVTYEQVGGFGPVARDEAFKAIKQAGNIGHSRPDTVWVQKGSGEMDTNLLHAVTKARAQFRIVNEIVKDGDKANEGWGVYYQYASHVIVEHTSDPNSVVTLTKSGRTQQLPHFHIEQAAPGTRAATGVGQSFTVERVDRMGSASPLSPDKAKFNHHVYYVPET